MRTYKFALSTLALFAIAAAAQAAVLIDVQFLGGFGGGGTGTAQTGGAVIGSAGDHWNTFQPNGPSYTPGATLLNTASGSSTVGISLTLNGAVSGWNAPHGNSFYPGPYQYLMNSWIGTDTVTSTVALTGLTPGQSYDLYLYSGSNTNGRKTAFTITGATNSATVTTSPFNTSGSTFIEGTNYVHFTSLAPDLSGNMTISFTGAGTEGDLNGFQIQSVPEPGTWALLVFSLTTVIVLRRRRV